MIFEHDCSSEIKAIFISSLILSVGCAVAALYGAEPPDPAVHWPGHKWIHFMKRLHVIMSIGCFLIEVCGSFFAIFALHRVLSGGFNNRAPSAAELLVRELEFEYVAVCSYSFGGAWLLMGPVAIRCFCMVQQGLRSDALAAAVCCLIIGGFFLVLSFFNESILAAFPYDSYDGLVLRFIELSLTRCTDGGKSGVITVLAWSLQAICVMLFGLSLVECIPFVYYRELDRQVALEHAAADERGANASAGRHLRSASAQGLESLGDEGGDDDDDSAEGSDMLAPLNGGTPPYTTPAVERRETSRAQGLGSHGRDGSYSAAPATAALWGFGTNGPVLHHGSPPSGPQSQQMPPRLQEGKPHLFASHVVTSHVPPPLSRHPSSHHHLNWADQLLITCSSPCTSSTFTCLLHRWQRPRP